MAQNNSSSIIPEYKIALVMSGGVSGGAYTAGVLDYMIEALEKWEEAKKQNVQGVPQHKVTIEVLSGASSGGICCAVTAVALLNDFKPVHEQDADNSANKFFDTWVNGIDIKDLLSNTDLKKPGEITSFLNSDIIDDLSAKIIFSNNGKLQINPNELYPRDYISNDLDIVLTLTNMRGIPYELEFAGGDKKTMVMHEDRMRFKLISKVSSEKEAVQENKIQNPIFTNPDIPPLILEPENDNIEMNARWKLLRDSSRATSAFPVGLKAVPLYKNKKSIEEMKFPLTYDDCKDGIKTEFKVIPVKWPEGDAGDSYEFLNLDGGIINNEPFSIARELLAHKQNRAFNERCADKASASVIIIDPSPYKETNDEKPLDNSLLKIIKKFTGLVLTSLRFRKEDLILAADNDVHSRFLILPERSNKDNYKVLKINVTSDILGGFGGFLDIEFRKHDFMLGRRNCQKFLKEHFTLDPANPIAKFTEYISDDYKFADKKFVQIIPVIDKTPCERPEPPSISKEKLQRIRKMIGGRLKALAIRIMKNLPKAGVWKTIIYILIAIFTFPGNIIIAISLYFIAKKKLFDSLKKILEDAGVYKE